ncbi:MAG: radical SAM protein [Gammaproteobacteria bacterium]|nr:radical SAM protein [Gammaproteobacteria bacterium]
MKSLTYIVTDQCNARCKFCAPNCGSSLRGHLTAENMQYIFNKLRQKNKIPLVVFTGGEPLLFINDICAVMKTIKSCDKNTKIRIVTNISWAKSLQAAEQTLKRLKNSGITEINYSVDDFHQKFIPYDNIKFAVKAAEKLRVPVLLAHKTYPNSLANKTFYEKLLGREIPLINNLTTIDEFEKTLLAISISYTIPIGRGADKINPLKWIPTEYYANSQYSEQSYKEPCSEILSSYNISPSGNLTVCCGLVDRKLPIFYTQNVLKKDIMQVMEKSNQSVLYNWLALEGPWAIKEYIKAQDPSISFAEKYVQGCQICQELFSNPRVLKIIYKNLDSISKHLSILRCAFEAQRYIFSQIAK